MIRLFGLSDFLSRGGVVKKKNLLSTEIFFTCHSTLTVLSVCKTVHAYRI